MSTQTFTEGASCAKPLRRNRSLGIIRIAAHRVGRNRILFPTERVSRLDSDAGTITKLSGALTGTFDFSSVWSAATAKKSSTAYQDALEGRNRGRIGGQALRSSVIAGGS